MTAYADDIILIRTSISASESINTHLYNNFGITNLGRLHYFLGIEVDYLRTGCSHSVKIYRRIIV